MMRVATMVLGFSVSGVIGAHWMRTGFVADDVPFYIIMVVAFLISLGLAFNGKCGN